MSWQRRGRVFKFRSGRAQLPVLSEVSDGFVLWFSSKDAEGRSNGHRLAFSSLEEILTNFSDKEPDIKVFPGPAGSFDVSGCMPMQQFGEKLFYIGWTLRRDVPYFNYTCVSRLKDSVGMQRLGPILPPDLIDQGYSGTFFVLPTEGGHYLGYYLSQIDWVVDELGSLNPTYDIKIAKSDDLLKWEKTGKTAIQLEDGEAGISGVSILKVGDYFHMWFSVRGSSNFRAASENAYRIGHAFSGDGLSWIRTNQFGLAANDEFEGEDVMVCYPSVFLGKSSVFMLYNGNGFGETGIFLAELPSDELFHFNR